MVLFREDEQRIREQERQEKFARRTPLERWLRRIFKITLVLGIFFCGSLILLAALGGTNPGLKGGIEDYLEQVTGLKAEVADFKYMGFFPSLRLDSGDIVLRAEEQGEPAVTIGRAVFSLGFFDLMLSRRRLEALAVANLHAAPGIVGEHELDIGYLGLKDEAEGGKPAFIIEGSYGEKKISAYMNLDREKDGRPAFIMPDDSSFTFSLGDILLRGKAVRQPDGSVKFTIETLETPEKLLSGEIHIIKGLLKTRILVDLVSGGSSMKADLNYSKKNLSGKITFPVLNAADFSLPSRLRELRASLPVKLKKSEGLIDLYGWEAEIEMEIAALKDGEREWGAVKLPLRLHHQELTAGPLAGTLEDGALSGRVYMDARALPAALSIKTALKGWNFGGAKTDTHLDLESKSKTWAGLVPALSGEAVAIAGEGQFAAIALEAFARGTARAMFSEEDTVTDLNCMLAAFRVEKGVAKVWPLFIDTAEFSVLGKGEINFSSGRMNLVLEPQAKGDVKMTPVAVSGKLAEPKVRRTLSDLPFTETGVFAPGFLHDAMASITMTGFGLTEGHPCYEFTGKRDAAPQN